MKVRPILKTGYVKASGISVYSDEVKRRSVISGRNRPVFINSTRMDGYQDLIAPLFWISLACEIGYWTALADLWTSVLFRWERPWCIVAVLSIYCISSRYCSSNTAEFAGGGGVVAPLPHEKLIANSEKETPLIRSRGRWWMVHRWWMGTSLKSSER